MNRELSELKAALSKGGARWVKASEDNLPDINKKVFVRFWNGVMGVGKWNGTYFSEETRGNIEKDFEWLDESPMQLGEVDKC